MGAKESSSDWSGIKNLFKYSKLYGGGEPILVEDDIFTTTIQLPELSSDGEQHIVRDADNNLTEQVPSKYRASSTRVL